ncbi:hypothetical protein RGF97_18920 [Streptomyces roseicoloratus]|uniref:DUF3558 domain-containing protein n=1 Tax=Streptomyces roseicoloratus TaxID=2508722 RepID=A0ABY9RZ99_9ACTN|nr:hypothetical protein [Streptomyces roseicoloratus]WMX46499.1 hypothetical protein RGF97_18920 [Streptomyces roseicoloratus]
MQRKAYAPGRAPGRSGSAALSAVALALGLGIGLSGCSADGSPDTEAVDSKAGPAAPTAAPGRYRTLFEPCGAVPATTLKDLLPGASGLPEPERDRVYRGTSAPTFDTDRRVGCGWKADGPDATHRLTLDVERVVSYDPTVSDDDRAQEVYGRKQAAAGIAAPPTAPVTPGTPSGTPGTPGVPSDTSGTAGTPSGGGAPPAKAAGAGAGRRVRPVRPVRLARWVRGRARGRFPRSPVFSRRVRSRLRRPRRRRRPARVRPRGPARRPRRVRPRRPPRPSRLPRRRRVWRTVFSRVWVTWRS